MRILVDAMGGDFAPEALVEGAVLAARDLRVPVGLVGHREVVERELGRLNPPADLMRADLITVEHAETAIAMDDLNPAATVRSEPEASISKAMLLLRQGEAEGVVTMGHTGAGLAAGLLRLGRIPGVRRPALATPFPTTRGRPCLLIDIGANADVRSNDLFQFAVMGAAYAERVFGIPNPRVGLVSIGEEARKGNQRVQDAWPLLEASDLNFVGNLEGRDVPAGAADVAVVDGFTGNVMIKLAEGVVGLVEGLLREAASGDVFGMLGGFLMRPSLRRARAKTDYRAFGGAVLLGVRGIVIIGHGRSDAEAVKTAIDVARRGVENDVVGAIRQGVADGPSDSASEVDPSEMDGTRDGTRAKDLNPPDENRGPEAATADAAKEDTETPA